MDGMINISRQPLPLIENSVFTEDHTHAKTYIRSGKHLFNYTTTLKVPNREPADQPKSGTDVFPQLCSSEQFSF